MRKHDTYDSTGLVRMKLKCHRSKVEPCVLISFLGSQPEFLSLETDFFYSAVPTFSASALCNDFNLGCPNRLYNKWISSLARPTKAQHIHRVSLPLEAPDYCQCIQSNSSVFSFVNTGKQVHLKHTRRHFERNLVKDMHHRSVASRKWLKS